MSEKLEILIVDDVKDNLLALRSLLAREDVKIYEALSGTQALELMLSHDFSVALLDIQMPGMNGFELAELMRGTNKTKNIPIIFVTALAKDEKYSFKGYESGAVDFLRKPLDPHAVKSKVNIFLELHQQKKDLEQQVKELREIRIELEQSLRVRDEFMAIASHELRSPLTSFKLQTQLRKRYLAKNDLQKFTPEKLVEMFDTDDIQIEKLNRLINDMLDVSRLSTGKLSMEMETFDLCLMVNGVVERNHRHPEQIPAQVTFKSCDPLIGVWDKYRIEQVVINLLSNAVRYGHNKPIGIEVSLADDQARIVVKDSGVGINEADQKRIFERYERAAITELSGLGLGLYIVSQIIEAHAGTISVVSRIGEGSEFTVLLPLHQLKTVA